MRCKIPMLTRGPNFTEFDEDIIIGQSSNVTSELFRFQISHFVTKFTIRVWSKIVAKFASAFFDHGLVKIRG